MIQGINASQRYIAPGTIKPANASALEKSSKVSQTEQIAKVDSIEIRARQEAPVTYETTSNKKLDSTEIASLKSASEAATENLRKLVEELILKQDKNYKSALEDSSKEGLAKLGLTTEDVEAAKQAVSVDGEFGVKAVSDRLVDFAIAISGGDKSKLSVLVSAIDEGFAAAKKALGGTLPEISQQTYDETMRKLNEWANETDS